MYVCVFAGWGSSWPGERGLNDWQLFWTGVVGWNRASTQPSRHSLTHNRPKHMSTESLSLPYEDAHEHHRDLSSPQLVSLWQLSTAVNTCTRTHTCAAHKHSRVNSWQIHPPTFLPVTVLTASLPMHGRNNTHTHGRRDTLKDRGLLVRSAVRATETPSLVKASGCFHSLLALR